MRAGSGECRRSLVTRVGADPKHPGGRVQFGFRTHAAHDLPHRDAGGPDIALNREHALVKALDRGPLRRDLHDLARPPAVLAGRQSAAQPEVGDPAAVVGAGKHVAGGKVHVDVPLARDVLLNRRNPCEEGEGGMPTHEW